MLALIAAVAMAPVRPTLVVVLSIDQFRVDYLHRFESLYLPAKQGNQLGGFRWLSENGVSFINARYHHVPTETGPGHAVIGTGSTPGLSGIIANNWFDRATGRPMYCVEDSARKDIFTGKPSVSPKNLRVTTMGDELELATNGQSKTASIAIKDRAAILLAGHTADGVVWFDKEAGRWTTSDYYSKDGQLPTWAKAANDLKFPDRWRGKRWEAALPKAVHDRHSFVTAGEVASGKTFPHEVPDGPKFYDAWTYTPPANDFVVETAKIAVNQLGMGQDDVPDVLTLNFSTNDYVGHRFGPHSPQALELSVATDRSVSDLLNHLNAKVPGGLSRVLFVLSADHGVLPMVEDLQARGIPGMRAGSEHWKAVKEKVNAALGANAIQQMDEYMVYLDHGALSKAGITVESARLKIKPMLEALPEVYRVYESAKLFTTPASDWLDEAARNGYDPHRSPDLVMVCQPGLYASSGGTGHGTGWTYDTAVPLVFSGMGLKGRVALDRSGPEDIAATVCAYLGVIPPNGSIGRALLAPQP